MATKRVRVSEHTYLYRDQLQQREAKKVTFIQALRETGSEAALSAVDSVEAALWLLSLDKVSQGLLLICQTMEVALKGLLEEIHVLLTQDKLDWDLSKSVVQSAIKAHRLGSRVQNFTDPLEYDPKHTCGLVEAFKRAREFLDFTSISKHQIDRLNSLRNGIIHYGGNRDQHFDYLTAAVAVGIPFLQDFYKHAYDLSFSDLIGEPVFRELEIVRQYLEAAVKNPTLPRTNVLVTFAAQLHQRRFSPKPPDDLADQVKGEWHQIADIISDSKYQVAEKQWGNLLPQSQVSCVVCGEADIIVSVSEPEQANGEEVMYAEAIDCSGCGLYIDKTHKVLARLHYGPITKQRYPSLFAEGNT